MCYFQTYSTWKSNLIQSIEFSATLASTTVNPALKTGLYSQNVVWDAGKFYHLHCTMHIDLSNEKNPQCAVYKCRKLSLIEWIDLYHFALFKGISILQQESYSVLLCSLHQQGLFIILLVPTNIFSVLIKIDQLTS